MRLSSASNKPPILAVPTSRQHRSPRPIFSPVSHTSFPDQRQSSSIHPSDTAQNATRPTSIMPNLDAHSLRSSMSDSIFYSFDILRSDPSSPSLQHIASSATYPSRPVHPNSQILRTSSSDGSAPAFRVAVAASDPQPATKDEPRSYTISDNYAEAVRKQTDTGSGSGCSSFPVFGSAAVRRTQSGEITDSDDDELSASNSGKRHVCPTCFKRFNRPSSLKIHVNTHTGATRTYLLPVPSEAMRLTHGKFIQRFVAPGQIAVANST